MRTVTACSQPPTSEVIDVAVDARGSRYYAAATAVFRQGPDIWEEWPAGEALPDAEVRVVQVLLEGDVWIGTGAGAVRIGVDGGWRVFTAPGELPAGGVNGFGIDDEGWVWILTDAGHSLFRDGIAVRTPRSTAPVESQRGAAGWRAQGGPAAGRGVRGGHGEAGDS